jgi:hypothetical protein
MMGHLQTYNIITIIPVYDESVKRRSNSLINSMDFEAKNNKNTSSMNMVNCYPTWYRQQECRLIRSGPYLVTATIWYQYQWLMHVVMFNEFAMMLIINDTNIVWHHQILDDALSQISIRIFCLLFRAKTYAWCWKRSKAEQSHISTCETASIAWIDRTNHYPWDGGHLIMIRITASRT